MPKGYGYDKAPKKSPAFKMTGFSYAGDSPMKGKRKVAEQATAAQAKSDALANTMASMDKEFKSSNILSSGSNYGSPVPKRAPLRGGEETILSIPMLPVKQIPSTDVSGSMTTNTGYAGETGSYEGLPQKQSFSEKFKAGVSSDLGKGVINYAEEKAANVVVDLGITALTRGKKKEPKKRASTITAFSQMNLTRKRS